MRKIMITVVASLHLIACAPVAQIQQKSVDVVIPFPEEILTSRVQGSLYITVKSERLKNGTPYSILKKSSSYPPPLIGFPAEDNKISMGFQNGMRGELVVLDLHTSEEVLRFTVE